MYDLQFIKKRRRRKIAALVAFIGAVGISALVIISFFTGRVGTFSVAVTNSSVRLSLSEKKEAKDTDYTSYLRLDSLHIFQEIHYKDLPSPEILDSEMTKYDDARAVGLDEDGKPACMYYLKYTFFVTNLGNTTARYNLTVNLSDVSRASDGTGRMLDDTVRVMVFENDANSDDHNYDIYAKAAAGNNYLEDGTMTPQEFVGYNKIGGYESEEHPLAKKFEAPSVVCKYSVGNFTKNSVTRYTIVIWLEGEDPQSNNTDEAPEDAKIKFGVDIKAYEDA